MRKRRVGVTARASQIAGNGKPGRQIDSEMAAPLCKENTNGHQRREPQQRGWMEEGGTSKVGGDSALRAHEALPHTRPGGKPPETPAPFPSELIFQNTRN